MGEDRSDKGRLRTVEAEKRTFLSKVTGSANLPAVPDRSRAIAKAESTDGESSAIGTLAGGNKAVIFGRGSLRHPSNGDRPEMVAAVYWISRWLQALIVTLVGAVVILATEAVFGWAGKLLVIIWRGIGRIVAFLGIG